MTSSVQLESQRREVAILSQLSLPAAFALLASCIIPNGGMDAMGLALPGIRDHFAGETNAAFLTPMVGGMASLAFAVSAPLAGLLIDRIGYRNVYIAALLLFSFAGLLGPLMGSIEMLVASRAIVGVAVAGALTAGLTGIGHLAPLARARMLGMHAMVGGIGSVFLFPIVGWLAKAGWQFPFAIFFLGVLLVPFALTLPPHQAASARIDRPKAARTFGDIFAGVTFGLIMTTGLGGMVMFAAPMLSPDYLAGIGVGNPLVISLPLSVLAGSAVLSAGFYGALYARLGMRGTFVLALCALSLGMIVAGASPSILPFTIGFSFVGMSLSLLSANIHATAVAGSSGRPGRALGIVTAVLFGSQALFAFMLHMIVQSIGLSGVFIGFGAVAAGFAAIYGASVFGHSRRLLSGAHLSSEPRQDAGI